MKKIKNFMPLWLIALIFGVCATSCNNGDSYFEEENIYYGIATLDAVTEDNYPVMTVTQYDGTTATYIFNNVNVNTDNIAIGTRMYIAYTLPLINNQPSNYAMLQGYILMYNSKATIGTKESTNSWATMQQNIGNIWMTGNWINIQAICTYRPNEGHPTTYELVIDEATLNDEVPVAHLIYAYDNIINAETREFYATFNVSEVWNRANVKGLKVIALGQNGYEEFEFDKLSFRPQ